MFYNQSNNSSQYCKPNNHNQSTKKQKLRKHQFEQKLLSNQLTQNDLDSQKNQSVINQIETEFYSSDYSDCNYEWTLKAIIQQYFKEEKDYCYMIMNQSNELLAYYFNALIQDYSKFYFRVVSYKKNKNQNSQQLPKMRLRQISFIPQNQYIEQQISQTPTSIKQINPIFDIPPQIDETPQQLTLPFLQQCIQSKKVTNDVLNSPEVLFLNQQISQQILQMLNLQSLPIQERINQLIQVLNKEDVAFAHFLQNFPAFQMHFLIFKFPVLKELFQKESFAEKNDALQKDVIQSCEEFASQIESRQLNQLEIRDYQEFASNVVQNAVTEIGLQQVPQLYQLQKFKNLLNQKDQQYAESVLAYFPGLYLHFLSRRIYDFQTICSGLL